MNRYINALKRNIDKFKTDFIEYTRNQYHDPNKLNKLNHAGEFGNAREKIVEKLVQPIIPGSKLCYKNGFVMNSTGSISKEQDLIFYDNTTPALTTEDVGYFPIETVIGVGQVKSVIRDTQELKKALLDLSEVKKIRDEMRHCSVYWRCQDLFNGRDSYQINNPYDQVFTFLICEKIDFDITSDDIDHYYSDNNIPDHLKHNVILDISNGIYAYRTGDNMGFVGMPSSNKTPKPDFIGDDGSDIHFFHFLTNISIFISNNTVYHPDMGTYLSPGREPRREL